MRITKLLNKNFELPDVVPLLWQRQRVFWAVLLAAFLLSFVILKFIPSLYMGRTLLLVEAPKSKEGEIFVLNEVEILRSRVMSERAVHRLQLMNDPAFNPRFNYEAGAADGGFKTLSVYGSEMGALPKDLSAKDMDAIVSRFLKGLDVRLIDNSNVIEIEFLSKDPNKAALITNTLADLYLEGRFDKKSQLSQEKIKTLEARLSELKEKAYASEKALKDYEEEYNLKDVSGEDFAMERRKVIKERLDAAHAEYASKEKVLRDVRKHKELAEAASGLANASFIQKLKHQKIDLNKELFKLSDRYGAKHPDIIQLKSDIQVLDKSILRERTKILRVFEDDVKSAMEAVRALEDELSASEESDSENKDILDRYNSLQRDASSSQLVFDEFLKEYRGFHDQGEREVIARVLSYAVPAKDFSSPNKWVWWSVSFLICVIASVSVVLVMESLDKTLRSTEQIKKAFGHDCFGILPKLDIETRKELADYIISKPSSSLSESVRGLRMSIKMRDKTRTKKSKVLTITSSLQNEGKTMLGVWIGRLAAKSDEKVIVIDANLRGPELHNCMGQRHDATLVDYLTGQKELDDVIQKSDVTGVDMIFGRSVPNSALDLVSTDKMKKLVETLRKAYDLVVIDSPACLAVSDSRVLASLSDQVIYVVEYGATSRDVVANGIRQFEEMDGVDLEFVLSNVDIKKHAKQAYGGADVYNQCND